MSRASSVLALTVAVAGLSLVAGLAWPGPVPGTEDEPPPAAGRARAGSGPVVVELFTSQGCSSCPPADRLLGRLAVGDGPAAGVEVIPLAFHVDYWNYIGWTDPFSDPAWSRRQRRYAEAMRSGRVYTPQLVVDGGAHCVGSDVERVGEEIARAAASVPAGEVELAVGDGDDGRLVLDVTARVREGAAGEWRAMVAVFENDLTTPVPRGENAGRSLENGRVVRRLVEAFALPAVAGSSRSERLEVEVEEGWDRRNLGVAVFLQDPETLRIHGAAVRHLDG